MYMRRGPMPGPMRAVILAFFIAIYGGMIFPSFMGASVVANVAQIEASKAEGRQRAEHPPRAASPEHNPHHYEGAYYREGAGAPAGSGGFPLGWAVLVGGALLAAVGAAMAAAVAMIGDDDDEPEWVDASDFESEAPWRDRSSELG